MITILCSGSRGDIQPYIALAQALIRRNQAVRIAAGASFRAFVEGYGVGFVPLSADVHSVAVDPKLLEAAQSSDNPIKMLLTFHKMKKYAGIMTGEMYDACRGSDAIVYHPGCTIGYFAAREMGIPSVLASPFPLHRTRERPSVIAHGRFALPNAASYALLQHMLWTASKLGVAALWKERFGALPVDFACPIERVDARHPSVISLSEAVFPRPSDWSPHVHQHGYWFAEEAEAYQPPERLRRFLDAGEKPLYVGFGSVMPQRDADRVVREVVEALRRTGRRGILCGMGTAMALPDDVLAIDGAPHTWLFERVAVACHHGGAGTTAAALRAGVPQAVVPFSNDQFAWAQRTHELGAGAKPVPGKGCTADRLAAAFAEALRDEVAARAGAIAAAISAEDGAGACADVIARLLA